MSRNVYVGANRSAVRRFAIVMAVCLAWTATVAQAGVVQGGSYQATFFGTDGASDWGMTPTLNVDSTDGSFDFSVPTQNTATFSMENLSISGNVDPMISVGFDVTNNTGSTQDYTFIFTIPIIAQTPATITGGSTGITITDTNGDGATLAAHTNGRPTYFAQIDGVDFASLTLTPIDEPNAFESETGSDVFGSPIPSFPGPAALTTIGIRYDFSLTAGDRAAVTGVFVIEAVPEPASLALLGLGGLLMAPRRWFP